MIDIYNEDCLERFKQIPNESVDLIVTDCPYHIISGGCTTGAYENNKPYPRGVFRKAPTPPPQEREYERNEKGNWVQKGTKHINLCGILNDQYEYTRQGKLFKHNDILFSEWLPEAYRVLKNNSHCYIFINPRNYKQLQAEAEKVGFKFQQMIIWEKNNATPNKYYLNGFEIILMLRKGNAKNINNMGTKNILKVPNIIGHKTHPTEKPVELNKILIENSTQPNELVLDPFMGTGSSGVACANLNRNYIGIEIDEKYFNIANERLKEKENDKQKEID